MQVSLDLGQRAAAHLQARGQVSTAMLHRALPVRLLLVERAQGMARSFASSSKSLRIATMFDPRVSLNVDKQPLDVRETEHSPAS